MFSFFPLIQNEMMKIMRRRRTWMMLALLLIAEVLLAGLLKKIVGNDQVTDMWGFAQTSTAFMSMVQIFAVIIAGDIVASEFTWGTIKLLLIRPHNRTSILLSKFIAVILFALLFIVILVFSSLIVGAILFGTKLSLTEVILQLLKVSEGYLFRFVEMSIAIAFTFMLSTVFRSSSLAIGLSIFLMFTGNTIVQLLRHFNFIWGKYILFANIDLSQYIAGRQPLFQGMTLGFSIAVLSTYFCIFLFLSWLVFTKRDVSM